ncbi:MAG: transcription repressor NadR [Clostridia bacterium]|nr:transcription repressor NadR [Clostridia bacterium]
MKGEERRKKIISLLNGKTPTSAGVLAAKFGVSRQVIVQDVALLRSAGTKVVSTPRGYLAVVAPPAFLRTFKVRHEDEKTEEELNLFVDAGGFVKDVFVHHKVYGTIGGELNLANRAQVSEYMRSITGGKSSLLKNVTGGYHYHTVTAQSEEVLDRIEMRLREKGFLIEK